MRAGLFSHWEAVGDLHRDLDAACIIAGRRERRGKQVLRSVIPHQAGAILMCNEASIHDAEIKQLCFGPNGIVGSQAREIAQMQGILKRL